MDVNVLWAVLSLLTCQWHQWSHEFSFWCTVTCLELQIMLLPPLLMFVQGLHNCASETVFMFQEASAIPFAALTAWRALKSLARITKGQAFQPSSWFTDCCIQTQYNVWTHMKVQLKWKYIYSLEVSTGLYFVVRMEIEAEYIGLLLMASAGAPLGQGQSWCITKNRASQAALQSALDYAYAIVGVDCVTFQHGSNYPAPLQNHASYTFNSYYQKNLVSTGCYFGRAAVTTTNPSKTI